MSFYTRSLILQEIIASIKKSNLKLRKPNLKLIFVNFRSTMFHQGTALQNKKIYN